MDQYLFMFLVIFGVALFLRIARGIFIEYQLNRRDQFINKPYSPSSDPYQKLIDEV